MKMLLTLFAGIAAGIYLSVLLEHNVYGYYAVYYPTVRLEEYSGRTDVFLLYCVRMLESPEELVNADGTVAPQTQCAGSAIFSI